MKFETQRALGFMSFVTMMGLLYGLLLTGCIIIIKNITG